LSNINLKKATLFVAAAFLLASPVAAEEHPATDLAKKLANPIASLISVPLQYNYNQNYGEDEEGWLSQLNIQPVIPFSMSENWNIITRTIFPLIDQEDIPVAGQGESGLGDIVAGQFFSPKAVSASGWTWGVGPVWSLPTAAEDSLGSGKWGLGPTGVALKQSEPWSTVPWSTTSGLWLEMTTGRMSTRPFCSRLWPT
jgi:hypothetical protein